MRIRHQPKQQKETTLVQNNKGLHSLCITAKEVPLKAPAALDFFLTMPWRASVLPIFLQKQRL
jgi:hypothetical protein